MHCKKATQPSSSRAVRLLISFSKLYLVLVSNSKSIFVRFTDFRGYTIRKRFGPELEERFKRILNDYNNKFEAHKALLREGLKNEDAAFIVQRWYKKEEKVKKRKPPQKDNIHPKLRQADLIQFSQNVSKRLLRKQFILFDLCLILIHLNRNEGSHEESRSAQEPTSQ